MRYDISIIDDNIIQFEELERYSLNKLKNIKFTLFSDINNLNEDFDLTDLLVINIKFFELALHLGNHHVLDRERDRTMRWVNLICLSHRESLLMDKLMCTI